MLSKNADEVVRSIKENMTHEDNIVSVLEIIYPDGEKDVSLVEIDEGNNNEVVYSEFVSKDVSIEDIKKSLDSENIKNNHETIYEK